MAEGREGREWRPGKATELDDYLSAHPLTPEEEEARRPKRPELRLRPDAPSVEVNEHTRVQDVIKQLASEEIGSVALRDLDTGVTTIVLPTQRYLELVAAELASSGQKEATHDGRIVPTEAALAASHVEQVDPTATWVDTGGR